MISLSQLYNSLSVEKASKRSSNRKKISKQIFYGPNEDPNNYCLYLQKTSGHVLDFNRPITGETTLYNAGLG